MGAKRVKQYLMLLLAIGVVAVVASGSGTFASFNAQVQHNNNTFATGTLLLHATSNGTTCASESNSGNLNVSDPTGCTVLFNYQIGSPGHGTLNTALTSGNSVTQLVVDNLTAGVEPGDLIKVTDTGNQTFTATATVAAGNPATIPVIAQNANANYSTSATVDVQTYTKYASIELKNAGTLNAKDIQFGMPSCTNSAQSTLTIGTTNATIPNGATSVTLAAGAAFGVASGKTVTIAGNNLTLTSQLNPGATTINFSAWGGSTIASSSTVTNKPFIDTGSGTLCGQLQYSVVQTDASFNHDSTNAAQNCALGTTSTGGIGCAFSGSFTFGSPTALTNLSIPNAVFGNSANELTNGQSRYFVIGVQTNVAGLTNADQNQLATFSIKWNIDQA